MDEYKSTAVIMTAVDIESRSMDHIFSDWKLVKVPGDRQAYYEAYFERDGQQCRVITCQQSVMGMTVGANESEIRFGDIGFLPRPITINTDKEVMDVVRSTIGAEDNEFHVHIGPMACGSYVVANSEVINKRVKSLFPHTVGLDMESYSVLYAAENATKPKPKALIVKSICDYADSEKSDQYQRFAAYTSSGYVKYLLEKCLKVK